MRAELLGNTIKLKQEKRIKNLQNLLNLQEIPSSQRKSPPNLLILQKVTTPLTTKQIKSSHLLNLKEIGKKKFATINSNLSLTPSSSSKTNQHVKDNLKILYPSSSSSLPLKKEEPFIDFTSGSQLKIYSRLKQNFILLGNRIKSRVFNLFKNTQQSLSLLSLRIKFFFKPNLAYNWQKKFVIFLTLNLTTSLFVSSLVFLQKINFSKKRVLGKATQSLYHFQEGGKALLDKKFELAESEFRVAESTLFGLQNDIKKINNFLITLAKISPKENRIKQGIKIVNIAQESAQAAEGISRILARFYQLDSVYGQDQFKLNKKLTLTQALKKSKEDFYQIAFHLKNINRELEKLDKDYLSPQYQKTLDPLKKKSQKLQTTIESSLNYLDIILNFLGDKQKKRYLLLFQNNNEIRATGGFIGTYALLDFDKGQVKKLKIEGIYNPAGQLTLNIKPPRPIRFFNPRWNIQDSNWFPDFPTSAQKAAWFLEKTGGPSVDGVIALTPDVIVDLLQFTGPIEMKEYNTKIDASNFISQTQREVEIEYDKNLNQPKKFLADLAPQLLNKIFNENQVSKINLLKVIKKHLNKKNLLFFSFDEETEEFFKKQNWSGEVKDSSKDYLMVVNSNISGGKTDNMIKEEIELKVLIQEDGEIINYLEIKRRHTGDNEWPSTKNIVYQRIYTPAGSDLLESRGFDKIEIPQPDSKEEQFQEDPLLTQIEKTKKVTSNNTEIFDEGNKTVFANWIALNPGEEKRVFYKYKLPFKITPEKIDHYSLLLQKQAGAFNSAFKLSIYLPRKMKAVWQTQNPKMQEEAGLIEFSEILEEDKYFAVALEKEK